MEKNIKNLKKIEKKTKINKSCSTILGFIVQEEIHISSTTIQDWR